MFKYITVNDNIKYHNQRFDFKEGITIITGPNGCGKSLLVEYLGFSLFGVSALRLSADKYPDLSVETLVTIKGRDYMINRNTKSCTIKNDKGEVICSGTKACNIKIIELLGYNYEVYKMGNYAAQEEITQFGKLRPSERKKAVDQVLGLGVIDGLIKYANEEASRIYSEVKGMGAVLQEPVKPIMPEGYVNSSIFKQQLDSIRTLIEKKNNILNRLSWIGDLKEPVKPLPPVQNLPDRVLVEEIHKNWLFLRGEIERLKAIPDCSYTSEDIAYVEKKAIAWDMYQEYQKKLSLVPQEKPEITKQEALEGCTAWHNYKVYQGQRDVYEANLITCPKCGEVFNPGLKDKPVPVAEPVKPLEYYRSNVDLNQIWENVSIPELPKECEVLGSEPYSEPEVKSWGVQSIKSLYEKAQEKKKLPTFLESFEMVKWCTDDIYSEIIKYYSRKDIYESDLKAYQRDKKLKEDLEAELKDLEVLGDLDAAYALIEVAYHTASRYEAELENYNKAMEYYNQTKDQMDEFTKQGDKFKKSGERLKEMKIKIKRFVLPSLEKVSSHLLYEMSEGLYSSIKIDDDFDITVNGMELATYSESEKAMMNIALRIGLGQVLTHKAFNCFIGDEIDASMRDERSQATIDCLQKLKSVLSQLILISHRNIEAGNYIKLK